MSPRISKRLGSRCASRCNISAFLASAPDALVLADARSLAFLAFVPPALVLADVRSLAILALSSLALVGAHACHSLFFSLALGWPLPHFILANLHLHAKRFQVTRLHQATREGRQRRLQLFPHSIHRVTTAAHVLGTRLLFALTFHRRITTLWPCSFPRRYSPLALCTLLEYLHQDQGLESSVQRLARSTRPDTVSLTGLAVTA